MLRIREFGRRLASERLVRNNIIYLSGTVLGGALGYAYHFLTARLLGPAAYSTVASAVAALYILTLAGPVMQTVAMRFAGRAMGLNDPGQVRTVAVRVGALGLGLAVMVALAVLVLNRTAAEYLQLSDRRIVYVLSAATIAGMLVAGNRGVLQGLQRFVALSVNVAIDNATRVVLAIVAIAAHSGAFGAVIAFGLGPTVAWIHSAWLLGRNRPTLGVRASLSFREVSRYALSAAVGVMGVTFLFNADVILVKHYLPADQAGIYAAGSVLGRVIYFVGLTVAGVMFPEVTARHARDVAHINVVDVSLLFIGALSVVFIGVYMILPQLVLFPLGSAFAGTRPLLGLFALALSLLTVANLLVNYFLSVNSLRFVAPLVGACILEVTLIVFFHGSPGQVLEMVVAAMGSLTLAMAVLYAMDRSRALAVRMSARA
jgi:O-antigen/teichoic acid export membrane protein